MYNVILETLVKQLSKRFSNDSLQIDASLGTFILLKLEKVNFFIDIYLLLSKTFLVNIL